MALPEPPAERQIGRYRIESRLGSGGMGEVYRAWDPEIQRAVAIKRLSRGEGKGDPDRVRLEARAAARLRHPGVVVIHDVIDHDGELYLVEDLVEGQTLRDRVRAGLPIEALLAIAQVLLDAMSHAQACGIVHGDLKPENIMISAGDQPCILDFGLARRVSSGGGSGPLVRSTGSAIDGVIDAEASTLDLDTHSGGTPGYIAPEVLRGAPADTRSDIWSLGVVFYEALSGVQPFRRDSLAATISATLEHQPRSPRELNPGVSLDLSQLVMKMLEKDPSDRPSSCRPLVSVITQLRSAVTQSATSITPTEWSERNRRAPGVPAWSGSVPVVAVRITQVPLVDPTLDPLATGLMESVRARLAHSPTVRVVEQSESSHARYLIETNLRRERTEVVIVCRLLDTLTRTPLGDRRVRGAEQEIQALQESLVRELEAMLRGALGVSLALTSAAHNATPALDYALYLQARGYLRAAKDADGTRIAVDLFERVVAQDPKFAPGLAGLARAYWRLFVHTTDPVFAKESERHAFAALALAPNLPDAQVTMGTVHAGLDKPELALAEFQRAIELDPTEESAYEGLARALEGVGRRAEAEEVFRDLIARHPEEWALHNKLGSFYFRGSRFLEARRSFQRAVTLAPDYANGFANLGAACQQMGEPEDAIRALKKAIELKPSYPGWSNLGSVYLSLRRYEDAADALRRALALEDNDHVVWGNLGAALSDLGGHEAEAQQAHAAAARLAERARSVNSNNAELLAKLAQYYLALGQPAAARTLLGEVERIASRPAATRLLCASAWFRLGETDRAAAEAVRAIKDGCSLGYLRGDAGFTELLSHPDVQRAIEQRTDE